MAEALGTTGVHFDFIGFDACLMATIETAYIYTKREGIILIKTGNTFPIFMNL